MSWISLLNETYVNLMSAPPEKRKQLLPIAHSTQKAHVEITIDSDGNFDRAEYVEDEINKEKGLSETVIPVTEQSAARPSGVLPHGLCDKLQYVAGDYSVYTGDDNSEYYRAYIEQLRRWKDSEYSHKKVEAVYKYLTKGTVTSDLIRAGIFSTDENGMLTKKWENCTKKLSLGDQADAFIRFRIINSGGNAETWQDEELKNAYKNYYCSTIEDKALCYVTGEQTICTTNHPAKIRNAGDKAKLISSNDTSNFTFKGRFDNAEQAVKIGYVVSQQAHNALKYLIAKQGKRIGDKVILLWGTRLEPLPAIAEDTFDAFAGEEDNSDRYDTKYELAESFNKAISGYKSNIGPAANAALICLDSATTGRMSVNYYREYKGRDDICGLIDKIKNWHTHAAWLHNYKVKDGKHITFWGAPSPRDIALCAYGTEQNDFIDADKKIEKQAIERIMPCISDGAKIPVDIVRMLVKKSFSPQNYSNDYNWKKVLSVSCSAYRKYIYDYNNKEDIKMEIDVSSKDISYNCGRLLAVADEIESWAIRADGESGRTTNAVRYFNRFSRVPCATWAIIYQKMLPYKNKLGKKGVYLYQLLDEISANIEPDSFEKARNLDGRMIIGYHCQKQSIHKHYTDGKQQNVQNIEEEN